MSKEVSYIALEDLDTGIVLVITKEKIQELNDGPLKTDIEVIKDFTHRVFPYWHVWCWNTKIPEHFRDIRLLEASKKYFEDLS